jgi:dTDP-4-dehydrorhamnose 3,5-epimerase/CDP-3, 6-dideoxy-D-glycero-D-glycero-4-hexulose-5-epimerase
MNVFTTRFDKVYLIAYTQFIDLRGSFVKTFNSQFFEENNLCSNFKECFYSVSARNVLRGMHFQIPPAEQYKLVNVVQGRILDVVVDIRGKSSTYGEFLTFELEGEKAEGILMGPGFAHGFLSLEDNTIVNYKTTALYEPTCDTGFKWDSFGFEWPVSNPVISDRDNSMELFENFKTPF